MRTSKAFRPGPASSRPFSGSELLEKSVKSGLTPLANERSEGCRHQIRGHGRVSYLIDHSSATSNMALNDFLQKLWHDLSFEMITDNALSPCYPISKPCVPRRNSQSRRRRHQNPRENNIFADRWMIEASHDQVLTSPIRSTSIRTDVAAKIPIRSCSCEFNDQMMKTVFDDLSLVDGRTCLASDATQIISISLRAASFS